MISGITSRIYLFIASYLYLLFHHTVSDKLMDLLKIHCTRGRDAEAQTKRSRLPHLCGQLHCRRRFWLVRLKLQHCRFEWIMNDQWSILLELDLLQIEWLKHKGDSYH